MSCSKWGSGRAITGAPLFKLENCLDHVITLIEVLEGVRGNP